MALLAVRAPLKVESTRDPAVAATAVTKANPGVMTATGHGLVAGDSVVIEVPSSVGGMVELHQYHVRVANVAGDDFDLEGLDTTNFTDWVGGNIYKITAWLSLCNATGVDLPNAEPNKLDSTTLCSFTQESSIGLPGETSGTVSMLDEPGHAALAKIQGTTAGTALAFRHTWDSGEEKLFNAEAVYGGGYSATVNTLVTASMAVTLKKPILSYAAP